MIDQIAIGFISFLSGALLTMFVNRVTIENRLTIVEAKLDYVAVQLGVKYEP